MGKRHYARIERGNSGQYDVPPAFRSSAPLPDQTLSDLERQLLWRGVHKRAGFVREVHNTFLQHGVWYQGKNTLDAVADFELFHGLVDESNSLRSHPSYVFDLYVRERWPTSGIAQRVKQKFFLGATSGVAGEKTTPVCLAPLDDKFDKVNRAEMNDLMWSVDFARDVDFSWLHNPDPAICAYHDFVHRTHLLPVEDFLAGLSKLYGRDVCFKEIVWGEKGLRATADLALHRYKTGFPGPVENPEVRKMNRDDLIIWLLEKGVTIYELDSSEPRKDEIDRSGYDGWL